MDVSCKRSRVKMYVYDMRDVGVDVCLCIFIYVCPDGIKSGVLGLLGLSRVIINPNKPKKRDVRTHQYISALFTFRLCIFQLSSRFVCVYSPGDERGADAPI